MPVPATCGSFGRRARARVRTHARTHWHDGHRLISLALPCLPTNLLPPATSHHHPPGCPISRLERCRCRGPEATKPAEAPDRHVRCCTIAPRSHVASRVARPCLAQTRIRHKRRTVLFLNFPGIPPVVYVDCARECVRAGAIADRHSVGRIQKVQVGSVFSSYTNNS